MRIIIRDTDNKLISDRQYSSRGQAARELPKSGKGIYVFRDRLNETHFVKIPSKK